MLVEEPLETADEAIDDEQGDPFEPVIEAADESTDNTLTTTTEPDQRTSEPGPPLGSTDVRQLFSQLQIRREADGRVIIEAPETAAAALGDLFEGMAALMRATARPS